MRRGKDRLIGAALCLLLLFGAGCSPAPGADQETLDRELDRGEYRRGDREQVLLEELYGLYEAYTIRYLGGDDLGWGYTDPEEHVLARYRIGGAGELTLMPNSLDLTHGPWTREDLEEMWESMQAVLPKDAFRDFRSYVPFTDGEGETVAYVLPADKTASVFEGAVTKVEMHNELRDTPKTGDDSNPALWFALLGVSAAGAAVLDIVGFRKRRKEDAE